MRLGKNEKKILLTLLLFRLRRIDLIKEHIWGDIKNRHILYSAAQRLLYTKGLLKSRGGHYALGPILTEAGRKKAKEILSEIDAYLNEWGRYSSEHSEWPVTDVTDGVSEVVNPTENYRFRNLNR